MNESSCGPAVETGLAFIKGDKDFPDGVLAFESKWMGADECVSFDRKAAALANAQGNTARLLK